MTVPHASTGYPDVLFDSPPGFGGTFRTDLLARSAYAQGGGIARAMPTAVAVLRDSADAAQLAGWAKREGHPLIPRGSGSGMAAGAVGHGVIVDASRLRSIGPVDVQRERIRVACGAVRDDVDRVARGHGLCFPVDPSSGPFCTIGGMTGTNAAGARTLRYGSMRPWVQAIRCVFDDGAEAWVRRDAPPPDVPAIRRLLGALRTLDAEAVLLAAGAFRHDGVRKESSGYALGIGHAVASRGFPADPTAGASSAIVSPGVHAAPDPLGSRLVDLLVGSEGTLAIFTEIELALAPVPPATASLLAVFGSLDAASFCATGAAAMGASACELLDRTFLDVARSGATIGVPADAEAVLLVEVEGESPAEARARVDQIAAAFSRGGATEVTTALDPEAEQHLWELRHAASPILARLAPRVQSMQFIEDGCVPPGEFPRYVRGVRAALARAGIQGVIFGHAGDAHAHVNPLVDVHHPGWKDQVRGLLADVCELTAQCGGTLSGEHGDGRLRAPLLDRVWSLPARAAFANIKAAGDPSGVLNSGCKVPNPGDDGLDGIRYGPDAPPIDPVAQRALDRIERDRAWSRFRLDAVDGERAGLPPGTEGKPAGRGST